VIEDLARQQRIPFERERREINAKTAKKKTQLSLEIVFWFERYSKLLGVFCGFHADFALFAFKGIRYSGFLND
jgi:hypothetical protein